MVLFGMDWFNGQADAIFGATNRLRVCRLPMEVAALPASNELST